MTLNQNAATTPRIIANASPLNRPTSSSRRTIRRALALDSSRVASARTVTVMVWVPALPPMLATIGISTASATIFAIEPSKWLMTQAETSAVSRLASSHGKRLLAMVQTESDSSSSPLHAAERLDVLLRLLLDDVDDVVEGDDADQAVVVVHHRRRDQVVALEQARHLFLVVGGAAPAAGPPRTDPAIGTGRLVRSRRSSATAPVSRRSAIDDVDLPEAVRQVGRLAHVVDGLADRPIRRDRDELVLHPPAGGVFRIVEAALERDALDRRQLLEDLGLILLRQVLEDGDGVVGIELAHALGDGLGRQLFEDLLADGVVDLGQRGEVEIRAHQLDQARAQIRIERLDDVAGVGLVQVADELAQRRPRRRLERLDDLVDISPRAGRRRRRAAQRRAASRSCLSRRACRSFKLDAMEGVSACTPGLSRWQFTLNRQQDAWQLQVTATSRIFTGPPD